LQQERGEISKGSINKKKKVKRGKPPEARNSRDSKTTRRNRRVKAERGKNRGGARSHLKKEKD